MEPFLGTIYQFCSNYSMAGADGDATYDLAASAETTVDPYRNFNFRVNLDATTTGDPEWRYVPVRRMSMDDGDDDVTIEELAQQSDDSTDRIDFIQTTSDRVEGDIAGNFRDTAEGESANAGGDTFVFMGFATESSATSLREDGGDVDFTDADAAAYYGDVLVHEVGHWLG